MPLQDDPFSRGKCAFKAVFCMSRGVPVIASPVGANTTLIDHGENGWLATSTDDWIEGISALVEDVSLRSRMGRLARETIEEGYSAASVAKKLATLLNRVTGSALSSVNDR
jgi:glycosyltransferase involved in cell wall biosynthesis